MAAFSLEEYMHLYNKNPVQMAKIISDELSKQGNKVEVSRQSVEGWLKKDDYAAIEVGDVLTGEINSVETNKRKFIFQRQVEKS